VDTTDRSTATNSFADGHATANNDGPGTRAARARGQAMAKPPSTTRRRPPVREPVGIGLHRCHRAYHRRRYER
jgi:hypothetical protein